jgi:hypothetical protein
MKAKEETDKKERNTGRWKQMENENGGLWWKQGTKEMIKWKKMKQGDKV